MATYDESFRQNIVILPVEKYLIRIVSTFILAGGFKPSKKNQSTGVIIPNKWKIKTCSSHHQPVIDPITINPYNNPLFITMKYHYLSFKPRY